MPSKRYDIAVIGAGAVGLAAARALTHTLRESVVVLEAEAAIATHQTGRNSGVIHSGLYYEPGSLKARLCRTGAAELIRFCEKHEIPHERCGKLVVATTASEVSRLEQLHERGLANGLSGIERLGPEQIAEREPAVRAVAGLWIPETGIVDYSEVARCLAEEFARSGGEIRTGFEVRRIERRSDEFVLHGPGGEVGAGRVVSCGGLQADRLVRQFGLRPSSRIVPFRGEYHRLVARRKQLVRNLIYPVPDPRFPFLGVHFTRTVQGTIEIGPNAVLATARHGYRRRDVSPGDLWDTLSFPGFWRLLGRYGTTAVGEAARSLNRGALVRALRRMVPQISADDLEPSFAGVRAQCVSPRGELIHDFEIVRGNGTLHVLNAPSPAATACLAIGREVARRAAEHFALVPKG